MQWQSLDLITWGLHYPSATGIRFSERDEPRPAFRGGRLCSAPLRPGFAGAAQLQKQEDDPHTRKQVQAPYQVKIKQ